MIRRIQASLATLFTAAAIPLMATIVTVQAPDGQEVELFLPEGREAEVLSESVRACFGVPDAMQRYRFEADDSADDDNPPPSKTLRDWERGWTKSEEKDIKFIIKALAYKSTAWLATHANDMKKRGRRIESVHPLRFMEICFTDKDLKYAMHELSGHGWDGLMSGLEGSLNEEMARNNMRMEFREAFATAIEVDLAEFNHCIDLEEWEILVRTLIDLVPLPDEDDWDL